MGVTTINLDERSISDKNARSLPMVLTLSTALSMTLFHPLCSISAYCTAIFNSAVTGHRPLRRAKFWPRSQRHKMIKNKISSLQGKSIPPKMFSADILAQSQVTIRSAGRYNSVLRSQVTPSTELIIAVQYSHVSLSQMRQCRGWSIPYCVAT
jgi:hypothetical protein